MYVEIWLIGTKEVNDVEEVVEEEIEIINIHSIMKGIINTRMIQESDEHINLKEYEEENVMVGDMVKSLIKCYICHKLGHFL